jgi:hypothetical protein
MMGASLLTTIHLPTSKYGSGLAEWGELSAAGMIEHIRAKAARLRAEADAIDAAADEDFQIDVVRGSVVQRHVRTVQLSPVVAARIAALAKARGQ